MDIKQSNAKEFLNLMTENANNFTWGIIIHCVTNTDRKTKSILQDIKKVTLNGLKRQASKIWHNYLAIHQIPVPTALTTTTTDPAVNSNNRQIFYNQTRSAMIAKRILGSISTAAKKTRFTKKRDFAWLDATTGEYKYNGPTILYILMAAVNPNTRVGISGLKEKICVVNMGAVGHNVKDLLIQIKTNYNLIIMKVSPTKMSSWTRSILSLPVRTPRSTDTFNVTRMLGRMEKRSLWTAFWLMQSTSITTWCIRRSGTRRI